MEEILFIYADDCLDCKRMQMMLNKANKATGEKCVINSINSETQEAIDLAVDVGICDIPACVIGEAVMYGKRGFSYKKILNAMKNIGE